MRSQGQRIRKLTWEITDEHNSITKDNKEIANELTNGLLMQGYP